MKLKASVDYGARAVVYLAVKGGICSSREISDEMSIPRDYLIQLALRLRNAGLIKARPGKNGGYVLAKDPADITIADILDAFDSELKHERQPMKKSRRAADGDQPLAEVHGAVMDSLNYFMRAISVQDIIEAHGNGESMENLMASALAAEAERLQKKTKR